jgi:hypothetical protein
MKALNSMQRIAQNSKSTIGNFGKFSKILSKEAYFRLNFATNWNISYLVDQKSKSIDITTHQTRLGLEILSEIGHDQINAHFELISPYFEHSLIIFPKFMHFIVHSETSHAVLRDSLEVV